MRSMDSLKHKHIPHVDIKDYGHTGGAQADQSSLASHTIVMCFAMLQQMLTAMDARYLVGQYGGVMASIV